LRDNAILELQEVVTKLPRELEQARGFVPIGAEYHHN